MSAEAAATPLFRVGVALSWHDKAACAEIDPEIFFPDQSGSTGAAKRICRGCDVRAECLEYALANGELWGVWGGLSARERRLAPRPALRQRRPAVAVTRAPAAPQVRTVLPDPRPEPAPEPARDALDLIGEEVARIPGRHIDERLQETLLSAAEEAAAAGAPEPEAEVPVPVAEVPVRRCRRCRYLTNTPGHKALCGDGR
jgi:WhiB family redox-sensing transcriptional regulator